MVLVFVIGYAIFLVFVFLAFNDSHERAHSKVCTYPGGTATILYNGPLWSADKCICRNLVTYHYLNGTNETVAVPFDDSTLDKMYPQNIMIDNVGYQVGAALFSLLLAVYFVLLICVLHYAEAGLE